MAGLGIEGGGAKTKEEEREAQLQAAPSPAETNQTTTQSLATSAKAQSSQFNVGDSVPSPSTPRSKKRPLEGTVGVEGPGVSLPSTDLTAGKIGAPKVTRLHQRRVSTSPQKFDKGKFELAPIRTDLAANEGPATKRQRTANLLEVQYDERGQPRIVSITPTFSLPSGKRILSDTRKLRLRPFNIIEELINNHEDLLLYLVSFLPMPALISLYAISKKFHWHFNLHVTACTLSSMRTWAPHSDNIFAWSSYKHLCIKDPVQRKKESWIGVSSHKLLSRYENNRDDPSLRWLQMVIWRHGICEDIMIQLAKEGLRCPKGTVDILKRIWFMLDLPLNSHRVALVHSTTYFSNEALQRATHFLLKLDMFFTDPLGPVYTPQPQVVIPPIPNHAPWVTPGAPPSPAQLSAWTNFNTPPPKAPRAWANTGPIGSDMRELLLGSRHLTTLWRVLRGMSPDATRGGLPITRLEVLKLWVRHKYKAVAQPQLKLHTLRQTILGIPWYDVGSAELERTTVAYVVHEATRRVAVNPLLTSTAEIRTHENQQMVFKMEKILGKNRIFVPYVKPREKLLRPDELIVKESMRRQQGLHRFWTQMMIGGFCDELGRNYRAMTEEELLEWRNGIVPPKEKIFMETDVPDSVEELDERIRIASLEDKVEQEQKEKEEREKEGREKEKDGEELLEEEQQQASEDGESPAMDAS